MDVFMNHRHFEFGTASDERGRSFGPIKKLHLGVILVQRGEIAMEIDGQSYIVHPGEAGLVFAAREHTLRYLGKDGNAYIWCGGNLDPDKDFNLRKGSVEYLSAIPKTMPASSLLESLLNIGLKICDSRAKTDQYLLNTLGQSVCNEYFRNAVSAEENHRIPAVVIKARDYIDSAFDQVDCSMKTISAVAALSPQHLSKLFVLHMGCTPIKYLWERRAEKALYLLKFSNLRMSEVALQSGFKDPFHFSRFMKMTYGNSPRKIRTLHWT
ncbi:MAG: helix-turn-helix transcriptional regulator [Phenylobacterium sp.]|uniref:helix-turn-helix transcriptional regulator n=1 Tax=Phenylobacterium sp. TaxID=1871053 RepID=UPI001A5E6A28|nr:AraC family transcriptional regulator [Phenylobacterium sp.]MBL8772417.1 helix-turn-helix transcriptional regulator [Phenylobacterium sp.]